MKKRYKATYSNTEDITHVLHIVLRLSLESLDRGEVFVYGFSKD